MDNNNAPQPPKSFLQVIFMDENSSAFTPMLNNVSPMQLYALIGYLRFVADKELEVQAARWQERQQMSKIIKPGDGAGFELNK